MKRFVYSFAAIVIASATVFSCNKAEEIEKEVVVENIDGLKTVNFTVKGKVDPKMTKTWIEEDSGTYLAHWSAVSNEHLGVVFDAISADMPSTTFDAFDITADVATFAGSATISVADHTMHPFYPASAFNKTYGSGKIGLNLIREQHPVTGSFDPAADVMIGSDQDITVADADNILIENVVLQRPMAVLRLHLKAKNSSAKAYGESVTSVEMVVADGKKLTGAFSYTPGESELTWNTSNNSVKAVFSALYSNADQVLIDTDTDLNSVYLVINPETLAEGTSITFDIETDVHSGINKISRTVTVPAGGMTFLAGRVNEIDLTVRDKDVPDVVADTRILVEGFTNETVNKTQTTASASGVFGTGVTASLTYTYSNANTNIRINSNGQTSDNPYLYINAANENLVMSNIAVDNQTYLDFSAKVKGSGATLTLKYKESSAGVWSTAGTYDGTSSFADANIRFVISNTVTSLDLQLIGSGVMYIDDIVLQPAAPTALTMSEISVSSKTNNTINYSWDAVDGAVGYKVSTNGGESYGDMQVVTTYTWSGLSASTSYTLYVKAIGDGLYHTDSAAKTKTETTSDEAKSLSSIAITTPPTITMFAKDGTFSFAGAVVTATYSDASTEDVTASCITNGSTLLATTGTKEVTVSYTEGGVNKTTTYEIMVLNSTTLTNANIVAAGDAADGYASYVLTDGNSNTYNAYAIKKNHSKATSAYHFLQIRTKNGETCYYIQIPTLGSKIYCINMTVSGSNKPMDGGSNTYSLFFSSSNETSGPGTGVASGTGASSVSIDTSSLSLNTGYITAGGAVRIWDIEVLYL